jgi:prevent-host-death family protein
MKATAKDLRFNSKGLLDTVNRGEEVVITFRGKPCAKLIPYREKK